MISVLVDTDILIDVALNRKPFSKDSSAVLNSCESGGVNGFIAWHSISNFYYIISNDHGFESSIYFIRELLQFIKIPTTNTKDALFALELNFADFEDALQVAAARSCRADYIISRNLKHYKTSPIKALSPQQFTNL